MYDKQTNMYSKHNLDFEETCLTYISSEHATTRSLAGDRFTINMGNTTYADKCSGVSVNKVILPHMFPNITQYNNVFLVGLTAFTIPVGQYTAAEIATTVTALFVAEPLAFTLTFVNERFVFTNNTGGPLGVTLFLDIADWLGFDYRLLTETPGTPSVYTTANIAGGGGTLTVPNPPALYGDKVVHVCCDKLAHGNFVHGKDGKLHDVLVTVPLGETPYGSVKNFEPADEKTYRVNYKYVNSIASTLDFQLCDSKLRAMSLHPNHHIQIVLKTYHKEHHV